MDAEQVRARIVLRLQADLIGPGSPDEIISDRPTERYTTGILYPKDQGIAPEEDDDGAEESDDGDVAAIANDAAPLWSARKPATAGLSFALKGGEPSPEVRAFVRVGVYTLAEAAQDADTAETSRSGKGQWRRRQLDDELTFHIELGDHSLLVPGIPGIKLYVLAVARHGLTTVTMALVNEQPCGDSRAIDEARTFFQVELVVKPVAPTHLVPRPSRSHTIDEDGQVAALIYREAVEYAVGHTCSATVDLDPAHRPVAVRTTWLPEATVSATSEQGDAHFKIAREHPTLSPLRADWLAEAEPKALNEGLRLIEQAYRAWISDQEAAISTLPTQHQPQAHLHIQTCRAGADRMRDGIALIEHDDNVRAAFQLSSRAMTMQYRWSRSADLVWRPFQLAFQLLALPSLADRNHADRKVMDLLWFPTGGGKTEAYLGLTAFILILRRLRATDDDDGSGVAVLMRYTLRLLTIQQFQRAAAMILACELLRRQAHGDTKVRSLGKAPFSIGLWVGQAATPTTIQDARKVQAGSPSTYEQLTECPACRGRLAWRVTTKCFPLCDNAACVLGKTGNELPVWTVDEDIYREAPSLVIATVDKFAQIVRKMESAVLFGRGANMRHAPPDLIIQDELHLISGPLGTMTGLYETAIDALCERDGRRPKVVGSTATIRRASDQVRALFNRGTYQFPPPGLDAANSGFALRDTSRPGRLYLGITTAGRSAKYVLQAVAASLLQAATDPSLSDQERDWYWTLVAYFNSLRELGSAVVLMQDDVPVTIKNIASRRNEPPRPIQPPSELTSRRRSAEIRDMLAQLGNPAGHADAVDSLLASNMISVGVDIQRLGLMVVNAQPKSLSEYIQATSRVGRGAIPGLVLTIYNASRARDRSHFETFPTWHRTLYREVEATSVTPFASRAQDKALHAVLVALVRHLVPGMRQQPALDAPKRALADQLCALIEQRAQAADARETAAVSKLLKERLDEWEQWWQPGAEYWADFGSKRTLLMSAEQHAAGQAASGAGEGAGGMQKALWPTPNSMREVEPGTPFVLIPKLRVTEGS